MYVVSRNFIGDGIQRNLGEIFDGKGFKHLAKLINCRFLVKLDSAFKHETCHCGRHFKDVTTLDYHKTLCHSDIIDNTQIDERSGFDEHLDIREGESGKICSGKAKHSRT